MRGLAEQTKELLAFAYNLLEELHPMTLRQLHYAILSAAKINYQNDARSYRRSSRVTPLSRRRHRKAQLEGHVLLGEIPHGWIVDETRAAEIPNVWDDAAGFMDTVSVAYRRDYWQDQPKYCEVWSEKGTVLASLRPVTQELGLTLRVCHGFGSTGMEGNIGTLFEHIRKPIHILYLGDYDPSGEDIERDIHKRAQEASGRTFTRTRLAIHDEDIPRFKLPPQRIKSTDSAPLASGGNMERMLVLSNWTPCPWRNCAAVCATRLLD